MCQLWALHVFIKQQSPPVFLHLLHYLTRDLARELVRELDCDLLWLNSIKLSMSQTWSQTWFPTCHRQVRAISTCRDSSNLVAGRFHYAILLASRSQTSSRPNSITLSSLRPASKLDSVMEFSPRHAHDVHTQVFVQLLALANQLANQVTS